MTGEHGNQEYQAVVVAVAEVHGGTICGVAPTKNRNTSLNPEDASSPSFSTCMHARCQSLWL